MDFFKKNAVALFIWSIGIIFAGLNIWQTMIINSAVLSQRVSIIELALADGKLLQDDLLPRFYQLEIKQTLEGKNIDEIKTTMNRLEDKIDTILTR